MYRGTKWETLTFHPLTIDAKPVGLHPSFFYVFLFLNMLIRLELISLEDALALDEQELWGMMR